MNIQNPFPFCGVSELLAATWPRLRLRERWAVRVILCAMAADALPRRRHTIELAGLREDINRCLFPAESTELEVEIGTTELAARLARASESPTPGAVWIGRRLALLARAHPHDYRKRRIEGLNLWKIRRIGAVGET